MLSGSSCSFLVVPARSRLFQFVSGSSSLFQFVSRFSMYVDYYDSTVSWYYQLNPDVEEERSMARSTKCRRCVFIFNCFITGQHIYKDI